VTDDARQQRLDAVELRLGRARVRAIARPGPRPVVFVHGLAASSAYFADAGARPELAGRGVVALDLPGFGATPAPDGFGFTMREQAEVVARAVEAVAPDASATLVGHSMGGTISVLAVDEMGARVARLVVAEAILYFDPTLWSEEIAAMSEPEWAEAFAGLMRRPEVFARGAMLRRRPEAVARVAPALLQTSAEAMRRSAVDLQSTAADPTLYERFLALAPPPVYVFGGYHDNTTVHARLTRDGARVEVVPRAGHLMMLDNPDAFYAIVGGA
jgi:pimeloyl-ACP methyl ester carboxylesterase